MSKDNVKIVGEVITTPEEEYVAYGQKFYMFNVQIFRKSEYIDIIPVIVSESVLTNKLIQNKRVCVRGRLKSCIKYNENGQHYLFLYVFAEEIYETDETYTNEIEIQGFICKETRYRTTPLGRKITDVFLAINRPHYNKSDYIPCIVWGRDARFISIFDVGTEVNISGRIQSRTYTNQKGIQRTILEVSAQEIGII